MAKRLRLSLKAVKVSKMCMGVYVHVYVCIHTILLSV